MHIPPAARLFLDHHLSHMQAHSVLHRVRLPPIEFLQIGLQLQGEPDGVGRSREENQERIAGRGNFLGPGELPQDPAQQLMVLPDQFDGGTIPEPLFERGGADDVREEQGD
jgi:hypothetical protein